MSTIKKILVPTDFSETAGAALQYVANLTRDFPDKEVTFVHVTQEKNVAIPDKLEEVVEQFKVLSKARCQGTVLEGELIESVLTYQKNFEQDLIVMGTKGREGEEPVSYGAEMVLRSDCPVLLVPEAAKIDSLQHIALALDKNSIDDSVSLNVLHGLAREKDSAIHVLTIENGQQGEPVKFETHEAVLEYYFESLDYQYALPENADIEEGINDYIEKNNIDLLAIIPRNHDRKAAPSEGRLTRLLTLHAKVPVLAID